MSAAVRFQNYLKRSTLTATPRWRCFGAPFDDPDWWLLSNDQIIQARAAINRLPAPAACRHTVITPDRTVDGRSRPRHRRTEARCMECYTIGIPVAVHQRHRLGLDDEAWSIVYEKAMKSGIRTICIHKAAALDYETSWPGVWKHAPGRRAQGREGLAAAQLHHLHGAMRNSEDRHIRSQFEKTGRIDWTTDVANLPRSTLQDVYAELVRRSQPLPWPARLAAAISGRWSIRWPGPRVWGSDSVWYGSRSADRGLRRLKYRTTSMRSTAGLRSASGQQGQAHDLRRNSARIYKYRSSRVPALGTTNWPHEGAIRNEGVERNTWLWVRRKKRVEVTAETDGGAGSPFFCPFVLRGATVFASHARQRQIGHDAEANLIQTRPTMNARTRARRTGSSGGHPTTVRRQEAASAVCRYQFSAWHCSARTTARLTLIGNSGLRSQNGHQSSPERGGLPCMRTLCGRPAVKSDNARTATVTTQGPEVARNSGICFSHTALRYGPALACSLAHRARISPVPDRRTLSASDFFNVLQRRFLLVGVRRRSSSPKTVALHRDRGGPFRFAGAYLVCSLCSAACILGLLLSCANSGDVDRRR